MKVFFICGKGGVGKTAVTAALGCFYASRGGALAVSLNWSSSFKDHTGLPSLSADPVQVKSGFYAMVLDRQAVLNEYIAGYFALKPIRKWILNHPLYPSLSAVIPGLKELVLIDKILTYALRQTRYPWKTVIVDMPSSGFSTHLFATTRKASRIVTHGPLHTRFVRNHDALRDPSFSRIIVVTLPEETPIRESREMILDFQNRGEMVVDTIVINQIYPEPFSQKAYQWLESLTDVELRYALKHALKADIHPQSVKHVATTAWNRVQQAQQNVKHLVNWWKEPVLTIPRIMSSNTQDIAPLMCRHLVKAGYDG
jgi:anion-transporting  ArsA/GET3 family ATPase